MVSPRASGPRRLQTPAGSVSEAIRLAPVAPESAPRFTPAGETAAEHIRNAIVLLLNDAQYRGELTPTYGVNRKYQLGGETFDAIRRRLDRALEAIELQERAHRGLLAMLAASDREHHGDDVQGPAYAPPLQVDHRERDIERPVMAWRALVVGLLTTAVLGALVGAAWWLA